MKKITILTGPPGSGKTFLSRAIKTQYEENEIKTFIMIQTRFDHQSFNVDNDIKLVVLEEASICDFLSHVAFIIHYYPNARIVFITQNTVEPPFLDQSVKIITCKRNF